MNFDQLAEKDRLIVALDYPNADQALATADQLSGIVSTLKVGKQLFTAEGPQLVRQLVARGFKVFLDLKFHDIPNTVSGAVRSAGELGVAMLTVHASGGSKMLTAAAEAAANSPSKPLVLAVTVLTSLSNVELEEIGVNASASEQVIRLASIARKVGCGGIVASAREAADIRRTLGSGFPIVTPGVRPAGADVGDQARVVTPAQAIAAGATHIVVGRPITEAPDPAAAAKSIVAEVGSALEHAQ